MIVNKIIIPENINLTNNNIDLIVEKYKDERLNFNHPIKELAWISNCI